MKIKVNRDTLLAPLLQVGGVVERKQTLPILSNILVKAGLDSLTLIATDLEVELRSKTEISGDEQSDFTLPARKLIDICKALPENSDLEINVDGERATLRSGRSRFTLSTLPAQDFPGIESGAAQSRFDIGEAQLKKLIDKTQFAMAHQDVRYYLNGMLLELKEGMLRTVATDGHRLALSEVPCKAEESAPVEAILPRKAVLELNRLLSTSDRNVAVELSSNHIRASIGETTFTSKLIDGKYPDYQGVIPRGTENSLVTERETLRQALQRTSILSNEKYRGIRFKLKPGVLELLAHNPEQEEAEEELKVNYEGDELVIGFNVGYLIDALSAISTEEVQLELGDSNSSCLLYAKDDDTSKYVIMPMRL